MIPGLREKCDEVFVGSLTDRTELTKRAREVRPDLVIIGPEEPLEAGCVDTLRSLGIRSFGPTKRLAEIESSKSWARSLLHDHSIDGNPEYRVFKDMVGMERYMEELGSFVIKPDGLTAGKGVRVFGEHLRSLEEAIEYAKSLVDHEACLLIEERLDGEEFSLQTVTDGETAIHLPIVQDHKRAYEDDRGPNTGGMGSYSCPDFSLPFLTADDVSKARSINEHVIDALARDTGDRYRGVLYGGFMATRDGVRLIEYNARFGDPEAMNVLSLLRGDFVELCFAVAAGELGRVDCSFEPRATVCKYIVPKNYPGPPSPGRATILIPDDWPEVQDLNWFWAACEQEREGDEVYLTRSRSGAVVGIGDSVEQAEAIAERAAQQVQGPVRHRKDIGATELIDARVRHMRSLRTEARDSDRGLVAQR
jgi:phosphoribosylamine--glycine ligase